MRRIDYKTIPAYLELDKKEVKRKLDKAEKDHGNFEHDLSFSNEITLVMEIDYDTNKWTFKECYIRDNKVS